MPTLDEITKVVVKKANRQEQTGTELAEKVNAELGTSYDGRALGRAIGRAVQSGKVNKVGAKSRPRYVKA